MSSDKRKEGVKYGYTTIQHDPRLKFDLSNDAYCVADAIYNLSNNPSSNSSWLVLFFKTIYC